MEIITPLRLTRPKLSTHTNLQILLDIIETAKSVTAIQFASPDSLTRIVVKRNHQFGLGGSAGFGGSGVLAFDFRTCLTNPGGDVGGLGGASAVVGGGVGELVDGLGGLGGSHVRVCLYGC
jgi:hypothetical protein